MVILERCVFRHYIGITYQDATFFVCVGRIGEQSPRNEWFKGVFWLNVHLGMSIPAPMGECDKEPSGSFKFPSFADPRADVVLVSADGDEFPVSKAILAFSSKIFGELFHALDAVDGKLTNDGNSMTARVRGIIFPVQERPHAGGSRKPFIELVERSDIVDKILRAVYPLPPSSKPPATEADSATATVLQAGLKYKIPLAIRANFDVLLKSVIESSSYSEPSQAVRLYALACKHSLDSETHEAARACLYGQLKGVYVSEFEDISAGAHHRLLNYHQRVVSDVSWALQEWLKQGKEYLTRAAWCQCGYINCNALASRLDEFAAKAQEIINVAPLSPKIYAIFEETIRLALDDLCAGAGVLSPNPTATALLTYTPTGSSWTGSPPGSPNLPNPHNITNYRSPCKRCMQTLICLRTSKDAELRSIIDTILSKVSCSLGY
jgi:hypothetical protein